MIRHLTFGYLISWWALVKNSFWLFFCFVSRCGRLITCYICTRLLIHVIRGVHWNRLTPAGKPQPLGQADNFPHLRVFPATSNFPTAAGETSQMEHRIHSWEGMSIGRVDWPMGRVDPWIVWIGGSCQVTHRMKPWTAQHWPVCSMCCTESVIDVNFAEFSQWCTECVDVFLICFDLHATCISSMHNETHP